jgi:hypothetical protein
MPNTFAHSANGLRQGPIKAGRRNTEGGLSWHTLPIHRMGHACCCTHSTRLELGFAASNVGARPSLRMSERLAEDAMKQPEPALVLSACLPKARRRLGVFRQIIEIIRALKRCAQPRMFAKTARRYKIKKRPPPDTGGRRRIFPLRSTVCR